MNRILTLLCALLLTGCYSDQKQQLASCELDAKRSTQSIPSLEIQNMRYSDHTELCMRAAGYEFSEEYCPVDYRTDVLLKRTGNETNIELGKKIVAIEGVQRIVVACYQPMSWSGKQFLKLERWLGLASAS